ncbi:MAG: hypothetical protein QOJ42_4042 [Acidobacteriaceae bacterium]|jgi:hypothetical protein|nr:hypothetical protein [Acidobacteriaceae bacterium]
MYVSIRRYKLASDKSFDELNRRVKESFLPILQKLSGLKQYYTVDTGKGEVLSVSLWDSKDSAEKATMEARNWVAQSASDLVPDAPEAIAGVTGVEFRG